MIDRSFCCSGCGRLVAHEYDANSIKSLIDEYEFSLFVCRYCHKYTYKPAIKPEEIMIVVYDLSNIDNSRSLTMSSDDLRNWGAIDATVQTLCKESGIDYEACCYEIGVVG
jgi:hypothetical protein